ncbi:MAG TPA: HAMP domain-containing sensor histidine kinase [Hyphomicrobium sp.]|nr:HAMP domain-containing sensor histidine kinase [Hyphomicrobium sp.]
MTSTMTAAALTSAIQHAHDGAPALDNDGDMGVVIVDPELAEIVAANTAGSRAIGLFAYASFPIALDASTPALARLRELAALGNANGKSIERLTFWSNGRLRPVQCTISRQGSNRSGVFVLRIVDENGAEASPVAAPSRGDTDDQSASERPARPTTTADPAAAVVSQTTPSSILDPDHLAKLAHELKTPLTAIAAAAEIMRDERLGAMGNARYLSYAADIHENATHALDVITSLLSESTKPGAALPRLIALDLNAVVERTVSSVQALAQSRNLTLGFKADKSRPHVVANPTSLRQILLNLLTNAIKFTPPGGDVHVETGYLADSRVFLAVRDTGCGISGGMAAATSSPGSSSEARQPWLSGSGIGLPLVQRLVREMSAEFEIESAPEKGTVARIAFGGFARWPA